VTAATQVRVLLYTTAQAAEALNVGRRAVYDLINSGQLTSIKVGGSRRIPVSELEKYISRLVADERDPQTPVSAA
jgi:excisionase family DNA binding protein